MSEVEIQSLEDLQNTYAKITCRGVLSHQMDAFAFCQGCVAALQNGGVLIIEDLLLPDDERVARYINAVYRLYDRQHRQALAEYAWRGLLLDVGLIVASVEVTAEDVPIPPDIHLQVMLTQAPTAAADFLQPRCIGTSDAQITRPRIRITGQMPG